jgi:PAS domain S-box-containing protein
MDLSDIGPENRAEYIQILLNSTAESFYAVDREGRSTLCNKAFLETMGFASEAEIIGRKLHSLIHHSHADGAPYDAADCPIYRCARDGVPAIVTDEVFFRLDGTAVAVEYQVNPIMLDGALHGAICTFSDVTQRRRDAERLYKSEQRYSSLFNSIDAGFCILELKFDANMQPIDYRHIEINPAFEQQTGLVDAVGLWVSDIIPGLEQHWFEIYGGVALTGESIRLEQEAVPLNRWFEVHAYRVDDPALHHVAVLFNDVTARKKAEAARQQSEAQLKELNETLEQRVQERTAEQERLQEQLRQSQKMEAVGQLTGGIAHDFNNLLTGITGSLELLQTRLVQGRINDLDRFVSAAQGAAKRAAGLTHRLLAFSRRQTLDPRPIDVNRLVADMEELIRRTMGPQITVEVVGAASLWTTLVDPNQLENALLNLCINARDAMPDGGRLTIETANKWLDQKAGLDRELPPGQYISLSVSDNGTGMSPEVIARAFDPFFTTKPLGQGTGLGLSMIYGFVRQSNGQVRIYSEPSQGTMVSLYLPRFRGEAEQPTNTVEIEYAPRAAQGETVLVVDDEPTVRMLITEVLEDLGYTALDAADGASGLKALQSDLRIDLLITDVGLPGGMNGRQLADAGRVSRPDLKVLFVTGYAENAAIGNGYLETGMHVMTKPFALHELAQRIKDLIEGSGA